MDEHCAICGTEISITQIYCDCCKERIFGNREEDTIMPRCVECGIEMESNNKYCDECLEKKAPAD